MDGQCRRSAALQSVEALRWLSSYPLLRMNASVAKSQGLKNHDLVRIFGANQVLICCIDDSMPDHAVCAELGVVPTQLPFNVTNISLSKES